MSTHPENEGKPKPPQAISQDFQFGNMTARVPEKVARGIFSTGVLVLQGPTEFVLDFVLRMNQPQQVAARVVLPISLIPQLIDVLKQNLENYRKTFGAPPPALPQMQQPPKPPTIDEIYQDLRISDDVAMGSYANAVMVVHSVSEFCLEFISSFYPKAVITSRVFLSAPQVPALLNTLTQSWQNFQNKQQQQHLPPPPSGPLPF